ncbi:MAG: hypothetical protein GQ564_15865 [Bacteroidales bacterium]|nr:hypothetical protein [Bacteroidales bacterium]
MKKIILVLLAFLLVNNNLDAQVIYPEIVDTSEINKEEELKEVKNKDAELNQKMDILYQHDGKQAFVNVKRIYLNDLYYTLPGEKKVNKIDQRLFHKIVYKTGRVEILNEKASDVRKVGDYRNVKVTEDLDDVEGLVEVAKIEAKVEGNERGYSTPKTLKRSATIVLRKKAALVNADIVLITGKRSNAAFGEIPSLTLLGIAYSYR